MVERLGSRLRGDDKVFGLRRVCKSLFFVDKIAAVFLLENLFDVGGGLSCSILVDGELFLVMCMFKRFC